MKTYIGTKIIRAEPMDSTTFLRDFKGQEDPEGPRPGYRVLYADGYVSWSPAHVFHEAYRELTDAEMKLLSARPPQTGGPNAK